MREGKLALMEPPHPTFMLLPGPNLTAAFLPECGKKKRKRMGLYHPSEADHPAKGKAMILGSEF